eukprot:TRINITY_DN6756_c0_g1_i3.p2 TRINITY_DN6756_c0_g1~~TRINITY_DN6756_c0_g1_i3.p2  ORF type:complete len:242 (+),score=59.40 TRINITY_DN6756_c0_g1_i3:747-1472(+)
MIPIELAEKIVATLDKSEADSERLVLDAVEMFAETQRQDLPSATESSEGGEEDEEEDEDDDDADNPKEGDDLEEDDEDGDDDDRDDDSLFTSAAASGLDAALESHRLLRLAIQFRYAQACAMQPINRPFGLRLNVGTIVSFAPDALPADSPFRELRSGFSGVICGFSEREMTYDVLCTNGCVFKIAQSELSLLSNPPSTRPTFPKTHSVAAAYFQLLFPKYSAGRFLPNSLLSQRYPNRSK